MALMKFVQSVQVIDVEAISLNSLNVSLWTGKVVLESVILTTVVVIFFPLGKIGVMIYGCVVSIIVCGCIIYDTDNLIKRYTYHKYIWAAMVMYVDIINLFLSLLTVFQVADT
ncbi:Protein LIFEGUARD 4 [Bienertia sinuspersici]